jgi:phage-related minor tail protein
MEETIQENTSDITKMGTEEVDLLSLEISAKINEIGKEALEKMNKVLQNYGLMAEMSVGFGPLNKKE